MVSKRFDEPARCGLVRTAFIRQSRRTLGLQLRIRRGNRAFEIFRPGTGAPGPASRAAGPRHVVAGGDRAKFDNCCAWKPWSAP